MKISKNTFLLMIAFILAIAVMSGCSDSKKTAKEDTPAKSTDDSGESEASEEGNGSDDLYVLGEELLEFTVFGNYDWYTMPTWGSDIATEAIKETQNVNITAIDAGGNAAQRLSTMIAGNELPDMMWTDKGADVEKLRIGGVLVPFDDYLDKYTNLRDWWGEEGIDMLRSEDGKLYQFPNWYTSAENPTGNAGYVINKGIYEALGSPDLETTDDLYEYLKMVQEEFPDITPFETGTDAQGVNVLYSAFAEGQSPSDISIKAVPDGDKLTSLFANDKFIESRQYAAKLFRERLITQDALSQDPDMVEEKVVSGKVAVYSDSSPTALGREGHHYLNEQDPDDGYFMIKPIAKEGLNRDNIHPGGFDIMGWNVSVITTAAENPEAIFAFLDWLTGPEGQSALLFGPEGLYWDGFDDEGFPLFTEEYITDAAGIAKLENDTGPFQWNGNSSFLDIAKARFTETLPVEERNWTTHWQREITWDSHLNVTEYLGLDPLPDSLEGEILQMVDDLAEEALASALYAKSDEEVVEILAELEANAQNAGYDQLLEFKTVKWQENLAKMNQ